MTYEATPLGIVDLKYSKRFFNQLDYIYFVPDF